MAQEQLSRLVSAVLSSTRGLAAVTTIIGSIVALLYLYVLNGKKTTKRPAKRTATTSSKTTAKKSTPQAKSPKRESPAKKSATSKSDSKEKSNKAIHKSEKSAKEQADKKSKASDVGSNSGTRQAAVRQAVTVKASKDDGEWITVAKKKPKASTPKRDTDDAKRPIANGVRVTRASNARQRV